MHYRIRVQGHLALIFQDRFGGLHIEHQEAGTTLLSGFLPDQAALHGVLLQMIRLGLVLLELSANEHAQDSDSEKSEESPMITEPKVEQRSEQHYVAIRTQVTPRGLGKSLVSRLFSEVRVWLEKQGITPTDAPFIRYLVIDMSTEFDLELGWPVASPLSGTERIRAGILPAGRYASLVSIGPYKGKALMKANGALIDWGVEHGVVWDSQQTERGEAFGARLESYIKGPENEPDPDKWKTEVAIRMADQS
ncbi:GyrI-like domain-containing protein [Ktedonobacter racemifer]|uniref:Transcriptional activator ligand binding domain protein n=1 Tax=Ktedonobacter racemifer DSM 44963 TaxID=485913 RepID=D6U5N5_KTERA|nr:transcriptional activator ligand binding domain protein [Ktedonobacter racemifer DSM 44963]